MIRLSAVAKAQVASLIAHYNGLSRHEASRALISALDAAIAKIARDPAQGLLAPRPYPILAEPGRLWVKSGRYWIAYRGPVPPLIVGVFFDTADIPQRS